jgi:glycosyltransferase involved in cell wall biosynthesis
LKRKLKILYLHKQGGGVGDYRCWTPARALERRGHEVWYCDDRNDALAERDPMTFLAEKAAWADVVVSGQTTEVEHVALLAMMRNFAAKQLGKSLPIICDADDDVLHVPPYNTSFKGYTAGGSFRKASLWHFRNSDALSVTTAALASVYAPYNKKIAILPNCVEPETWDELPVDPDRAKSGDIRICFAGGIGRLEDINQIRDALEIVMRQRPQVRLYWMAMIPDWAVEQWMPSTSDPSQNRAFFIMPANVPLYKRAMKWLAPDIFLAPVVTNAFNAAKSNLKAMEAAMMGAACVATDWATYADVPDSAILWASTTYEWKESLLALIDDAALRAKKVAAAREWVLAERSIDAKIHLWEDFYEEVTGLPVIDDDGNGMADAIEVMEAAP